MVLFIESWEFLCMSSILRRPEVQCHCTCWSLSSRYCPFAYKWRVILLTHCPQICVRKEISRPGFFEIRLYSVVHSIDLRRVFLAFRKYFDKHFWGQCVMPGVVGGLYMYGQNLPYKVKKSYDDFWNRNFEKSHTNVELLVPGQIWYRIRYPWQILE
jgi:hypothetical protein